MQKDRGITYAQALNDAMSEEMDRDPTVFTIGEDIRGRTTLWGGKPLDELFDRRIINTPISEAGIIGVGLGAALTGMRPIAQLMFVDLAFLAMDQIANQVAKCRYMSGGQVKVPLTILIPQGASGGSAAHHSQSLEAIFMHIPGLKVAVPSTSYDAKGLLKTAIRGDDPVIFLTHKRLMASRAPVPEGDYTIPFGQADIKRSGKDVTIVSWLYTLTLCLTAAEKLEKEGISTEVIDLRTLVPFDGKTILESVKKTGRLIVAEEECKRGGAAAEVAAIIAEEGFKYLRSPVKRVTSADVPIPYARVMEDFVLPKVDDIVNAAKEIV